MDIELILASAAIWGVAIFGVAPTALEKTFGSNDVPSYVHADKPASDELKSSYATHANNVLRQIREDMQDDTYPR